MNELKNPEESAVALPNLNVNVSVPDLPPKESEIVKAEQIVNYSTEIIDEMREDRKEINDVLQNFINMVLNEGEASTSSKEAIVNLMKLKSDIADKKTKVLDLMLRAFLKEKDSGFPKYLAAHQHNQINIEDTSKKRRLIKEIQNDK